MNLELGKQYRWTIEGTAVERPLIRLVLELTDGHHIPLPSVGKIDKLPDPLPTTPGSVISVNGFVYARTGEDTNGKHWAGLVGSDRGGAYSDAEFADADVTVKFDAGA